MPAPQRAKSRLGFDIDEINRDRTSNGPSRIGTWNLRIVRAFLVEPPSGADADAPAPKRR